MSCDASMRGQLLVAIWYGFMLTAVLFVPLAVLVHKVLAPQGTPYMAVATAFGVVGGVVQFLGLVRWPFLVPYLADVYLDPASSGATRESVAVVFQAFNQYAGVGVGENLGYLFTGLWTLLVAQAMFGSALPLRRWLGLLGVVSAVGMVLGMLEPAGFEPAANIVVVGYILWSIWLTPHSASFYCVVEEAALEIVRLDLGNSHAMKRAEAVNPCLPLVNGPTQGSLGAFLSIRSLR